MSVVPPPGPAGADRGEMLRLFVESRIGGEPFEDEVTSDQMVRTITKTTGVLGTLVDSTKAGLAAARPITKVIRGSAVSLYLLAGTLAETGIKRGVGLFVLSLGGALVAIDLLTGATPAWLTAAGFGILLGGLAYAALRTRLLTHALVLGTPVIPLLVWSLSIRDDEGADGTRFAQIALIGALILGLLLMGVVRDPQGTPSDFLRDNWRPLAGAVGVVVAVVGGVVLVRALRSEAPPWVLPTTAGMLAFLLVVAALLAVRLARRDVVRRAGPARWAIAYGAIYAITGLAGAWAIRLDRIEPGNLRDAVAATSWTFVLLAVLCLLVAIDLGRRPETSVLRLHVRLLDGQVPPGVVQAWQTAVGMIFERAGIRVRVVSSESVPLRPGAVGLVTPQLPADGRALFSLRGGMEIDDVAVYVVRSLIVDGAPVSAYANVGGEPAVVVTPAADAGALASALVRLLGLATTVSGQTVFSPADRQVLQASAYTRPL